MTEAGTQGGTRPWGAVGMRLREAARVLGRLARWQRCAFAIGAGAALALTMPPFELWPLLPVLFCTLFWLVDGGLGWAGRDGVRGSGVSARTTALIFFFFAFGFNLAGLWWIGISFQMRNAALIWAAPPAVIALCAALALFQAIAGYLYGATLRRWSLALPGRVLLLALLWTLCEFARGHLLTGFPWNLIATAWTSVPPTAQAAALLGSYGLGHVTVLAALLPALLLGWLAAGRPQARATLVLVFALALPLPLLSVWGALRLDAADQAVAAAGRAHKPTVRIVQPNVDQTRKWQRELAQMHVSGLIELSQAPSDSGTAPALILWPETAVPYNLLAEPALVAAIAAQALTPGQVIVTGAPRAESRPSPDEGGARLQIWNSLYAIHSDARLQPLYDKLHLVPFGEYMPLRQYLPFGKMVPGSIDYSAGEKRPLISLAGLPAFVPLICYEVIFSGEIIGFSDADARPYWMLNVTNDAWFGTSSGPYQHLASAQFRAIEEGIPAMRSANTGISAVIDAYGRVLMQLPLQARGFLDSALPAPTTSPTPYSDYGNFVLPVVLFCVAAVMLGFSPLLIR